jgi:hypothetical protein
MFLLEKKDKVADMDSPRFDMFLEIMKLLEKEDVHENDSVEAVFIKVIRKYEDRLSPEQRRQISEMFPNYKEHEEKTKEKFGVYFL